MRLQAATSLLHLSTIRHYAAAVDEYFVLIALSIQDSVYQVRMRFLDKMVSLLSKNKISIRYNMLPFLCVHDPEADVKSKVRSSYSLLLTSSSSRLTTKYLGTSIRRGGVACYA